MECIEALDTGSWTQLPTRFFLLFSPRSLPLPMHHLKKVLPRRKPSKQKKKAPAESHLPPVGGSANPSFPDPSTSTTKRRLLEVPGISIQEPQSIPPVAQTSNAQQGMDDFAPQSSSLTAPNYQSSPDDSTRRLSPSATPSTITLQGTVVHTMHRVPRLMMTHPSRCYLGS